MAGEQLHHILMNGEQYLANANGLVIITSALFAIAQYTETSHGRSVKKLSKLIDTFLSDKKLLKKSEELRNMYDDIKNHSRLRASAHIICLFIMLIIFAFMETSLMLCPSHSWERKGIIVMGAVLVAIGIWLGIWMLRMGTERKKFEEEVISFKQMCVIAKQTSRE